MMLEANKLHKSYGNKFNQQEVLKGIDMNVEEGEFISIMGASGSSGILFMDFAGEKATISRCFFMHWVEIKFRTIDGVK